MDFTNENSDFVLHVQHKQFVMSLLRDKPMPPFSYFYCRFKLHLQGKRHYMFGSGGKFKQIDQLCLNTHLSNIIFHFKKVSFCFLMQRNSARKQHLLSSYDVLPLKQPTSVKLSFQVGKSCSQMMIDMTGSLFT